MPARQSSAPTSTMSSSLSQATRILESRRATLEVTAALKAQREAAKLNEDNLARRDQELQQRDIQLQESLLRFNRFLVVRTCVLRHLTRVYIRGAARAQENDSKRARMERRAAAERALRLQKEEDILALRDDMARCASQGSARRPHATTTTTTTTQVPRDQRTARATVASS